METEFGIQLYIMLRVSITFKQIAKFYMIICHLCCFSKQMQGEKIKVKTKHAL